MGEILPKASALAVLLLTLSFAPGPGRAESTGDPQQAAPEPRLDPQACLGIELAAERLACYDRAVGRNARPGSPDDPPPSITAPPPPGGGPPELLATARSGAAENSPSSTIAASLLDSRWELSRTAKLGSWSLRGYKPIYVLPFFWNDSPNTAPSSPAPDHTVNEPDLLNATELKYQISLKTKVREGIFGRHGDLWFGYTQSSRWQLYTEETSRPFRETNYEPEAMLIFPTRYRLFGLDGRLVGLSLNHQSNGRSNPYSRGWNRLIGMVGLEREGWTVMLRPWIRLQDHSWDDDNPDIEGYFGRGEVQIVRRLHGHELGLLLRHSFHGGRSSRGAAAFEWAFPIHGELKGYFEIFHGYGESLIDYNHRTTMVGLGVSLIEWY